MKKITLFKDNIKVSLILSVLFLNFIWLAEIRILLSDSLNSFSRYFISFLAILFFFLVARKFRIDIFVLSLSIFIFLVIFIVNMVNMEVSLFSVSFYIFPFLICLFYANTKLEVNIQKYLFLFHLVIFLYALKIYFLIQNGSSHLLNENEILIFSLVISVFSLILADLFVKNTSILIYFNLPITFLIAYMMQSRAGFISVVLIGIFTVIGKVKKLKSCIIYCFSATTFIIPLIIVEFSEYIELAHKYALVALGSSVDTINADFDRYKMFNYVGKVVTNNFFGKGIGSYGYRSDISIAGLHSGGLDLLYWGGYFLYTGFILTFIIIILRSYAYSKRFVTAFLLIYWLMLLNYYEGLLFGNMGLTILYIYLVMSFYNQSKTLLKV